MLTGFGHGLNMLIVKLKFKGKFSDGNTLWESLELSDVCLKLRDWGIQSARVRRY